MMVKSFPPKADQPRAEKLKGKSFDSSGFTPLEVLGTKILQEFLCFALPGRKVKTATSLSKAATKKNRLLTGFTLVELLVGIGFFSMVMIVLTSAFLATFRSQRAGFAFLNAQNNVRFVLEVMAREMRTGVGFSSPAPDRVQFTNDRDQLVEYCLGGMAIRKATGAACSSSSPPMTAASVTVENLVFILTGQNPGDGIQPRVTTIVRVTSGSTRADVQTTVTQRELDS